MRRQSPLMLTSLLFSNIIGGPLAGILLDTTFFGLHGWRTLFIVEAIPAVIFAFIFRILDERAS